MKELLEFGLSIDDVSYIKSHYDESIISSILYSIDNVKKVADYFKSKDLNIRSLLINRLDVFLIEQEIIEKKLSKYETSGIFEMLKNDFSIFDNLS